MDSFSKNGSAVYVSEDNPLPVTATVDVGDVEIGAVEIKDGTAATRAAVLTTVPTVADPGLVTRSIETRAATAVITSVAGSLTTGVLKAANTSRLGLTVFNDSTANLYLAFAASATTSAYTVKIGAGGYWEMPRPCYTGAVSGIWDVANGNARVTEMT
jgi:hypothetical protein